MPLATHSTIRVLALLGAVRNMKHKLNLFFAFKGLIVIVVEGNIPAIQNISLLNRWF